MTFMERWAAPRLVASELHAASAAVLEWIRDHHAVTDGHALAIRKSGSSGRRPSTSSKAA
jgi:hypothetical protein